MAKDIGLGLQTVQATDLIRDGDNVISANALATKAALEQTRGRMATIEAASGFGDIVGLTDQMVAPLIPDEGTATHANLVDLIALKMVDLIAGATTTVKTLAELKQACTEGGLVSVIGGPITLSSTVMVTARTTISGGEFVLPSSAAGLGFHIKASGSSISGAKFTGAGIGAGWSYDRRFIHAEGTSQAPLRNISVRNCTMDGCQSDNVRLTWCLDSDVSNNQMKDFLYSGVMLISVDSVNVIGNKIRNAPLSAGVVNTYGIASTDSENTQASRSRNVKVIGNTVENIQWEGIDTHGGDSMSIIGNTVRNCPRGIALVVGNNTRIGVPTNCIVHGNFIDKGTANDVSAISLWGNSALGLKSDAIITGNIIRGYSDSSAIYLNYYDILKTLIEGNSHPHIPWTDLAITNTTDWKGVTGYPMQYMVEGRHVYLRGFASPNSSARPPDSTITVMPVICRTNNSKTFVAVSHGSNSAAGFGTLTADITGELQMRYRTTSDAFAYPIEGSYMRQFG